jgi:hypothetical protein
LLDVLMVLGWPAMAAIGRRAMGWGVVAVGEYVLFCLVCG